MAYFDSTSTGFDDQPTSFEILGDVSEIQRSTYPGIRIRGPSGMWEQPTLGELPNQEKEILRDRFSLCSWLCGVAMTDNDTAEPMTRIFEDMETVSDYLVVGEYSDKNVHHIHFLIKTNQRVDAAKRSILAHAANFHFQLDLCKLATARFWWGIFCYLLKNPLVVFASSVDLASLAFSAIESGDTLRYLKKQEPDEGKEVVSVINKIISKFNCTSTEDIFIHGGNDLVKFLHLSSLESVMKNCLSFHSSLRRKWDPKSFKYAPEADPTIIHNIILNQRIDPQNFDLTFWKWICRENGKKNTIILQGPSNTGKSCFIRGLISLTNAGSIINTSSAFFAEGIAGQNLGVWEEPLLTLDNSEMFKLISEGAPCQLPQKFKKPYNHPGCPILITTNHNICRFCTSEEQTIMNRCIMYHFSNPVCSSSGPCSESCLSRSREQRRSTPCYLNWSSNSGNFNRETRLCNCGHCSQCRSSISRCKRWWCGGNNFGPCSHCCREAIKRSDTGGSGSSACSSTSGNYRSSGGENKTGSPRDGIRAWDPEQIHRRSERSGQLSPGVLRSGIECRSDNRLGGYGLGDLLGGRGESDLKCEEVYSGGEWSGSVETKTEIEAPFSRQICSCLIEPLPQDWQAYLCYLARKYG